MLSEILSAVVAVVVLAGFAGVVWFFRIRKKMIARQAGIARLLEELYRPRDKNYVYLGYLVGFRADYLVGRDGVRRVTALYTTPPYHVFLYLPVIILARKRERLEIVHWLGSKASIRGEAHIADMSVHSVRLQLRADLGRPDRYKETVIEAGGRRYKAYYRGEEALARARALLKRLSQHARVYRVSVDGSRRAVMASIEPRTGDTIRILVRELWRMSRP